MGVIVSGLMRLIGPISCCIRRSWRSFSVSANLTTRLDDAPCPMSIIRHVTPFTGRFHYLSICGCLRIIIYSTFSSRGPYQSRARSWAKINPLLPLSFPSLSLPFPPQIPTRESVSSCSGACGGALAEIEFSASVCPVIITSTRVDS